MAAMTEVGALAPLSPAASEPPRDEPYIQPEFYRHVLGSFPTGVVAITGMDCETGGATGLAANSFCSVSLDPPLVAFCVAHTSSSWPRVRGFGQYCINVLAHDQESISARLAVKGSNELDGLEWHRSPRGSPVLTGAIAWLDVRLEAEHVAGDHSVVISRVLDLAAIDARPLIFFRGEYRKIQH